MAKWLTQLLSAKRKTQASDSFLGTCVQFVLSDNTELFLQQQSNMRESILQDFFQKVEKIIALYHGELALWNGSQLVFFIREQQSQNTASLALSSVRNIFQQTLSYENFFLKASFVSGQMSFSSGSGQNYLIGVPYLESLKILGFQKEQNENTLCFFRTELADVRDFCTPKELTMTLPRASDADARLCQVRKFTSLNQLLQNHIKPEYLSYFRGEDEITELLTNLMKRVQCGQFDQVTDSISTLHFVQFSEISGELYLLFKRFFNIVLRLQKDNQELQTTLHALVKVTPHLVSRKQYDSELRELLVLSLHSGDESAQLEKYEVLFLYCHDLEIYETFFASQVNRELAEKLLPHAQTEIPESWYVTLNDLFQSADMHSLCLALYVVEQVAEQQYGLNAQALTANQNLKLLINKISKLTQDLREPVRRRALACQKTLQYLRLAA